MDEAYALSRLGRCSDPGTVGAAELADLVRQRCRPNLDSDQLRLIRDRGQDGVPRQTYAGVVFDGGVCVGSL